MTSLQTRVTQLEARTETAADGDPDELIALIIYGNGEPVRQVVRRGDLPPPGLGMIRIEVMQDEPTGLLSNEERGRRIEALVAEAEANPGDVALQRRARCVQQLLEAWQ